jgi:hypothetical protein
LALKAGLGDQLRGGHHAGSRVIVLRKGRRDILARLLVDARIGRRGSSGKLLLVPLVILQRMRRVGLGNIRGAGPFKSENASGNFIAESFVSFDFGKCEWRGAFQILKEGQGNFAADSVTAGDLDWEEVRLGDFNRVVLARTGLGGFGLVIVGFDDPGIRREDVV